MTTSKWHAGGQGRSSSFYRMQLGYGLNSEQLDYNSSALTIEDAVYPVVYKALLCTVLSLPGGNRKKFTAWSNTSYRLQPLEGLLKLYK